MKAGQPDRTVGMPEEVKKAALRAKEGVGDN